MGVLKIYWRVMGCLNYQKVWKFARFCKNQNFQVAGSQKNFPPFQVFSNPSPHTSLSPPTPTPTVLSVVLFLWLNGWSQHIWCAILLDDNMDLNMSSLGTLVPETPWCVVCNKDSSLLRSDTMWFFTGNLIWYHTHKHTVHSGSVDWHSLVNIYLHHHLLCAHNSYLYYIKWLNEQFTDIENLLSIMGSFQKLFTCKSHVSVD